MGTILRQDGSMGADWRRRRNHKADKGRQTAGRIKGATCQASPIERHMTKCSRAYKHRDYTSVWNKILNKSRGGK